MGCRSYSPVMSFSNLFLSMRRAFRKLKQTRRGKGGREKERHSEALKEWERLEDACKDMNATLTACWKDELALWEAERDKAKAEKWKIGWKKPVRGKLEEPLPWPKKIACTQEVESEETNKSDIDVGSDGDA